ncbi:MAG TPA: hypothetical protein VF294_06430, partial [Polyangiaceae bacterium]
MSNESNRLRRAGALQLSLLASLGLLPFACGGSVIDAGEPASGGASGRAAQLGSGGSAPARDAPVSAGGVASHGGVLGHAGSFPDVGGSETFGGSAPAIGIPECGAETVDPTTLLTACANG